MSKYGRYQQAVYETQKEVFSFYDVGLKSFSSAKDYAYRTIESPEFFNKYGDITIDVLEAPKNSKTSSAAKINNTPTASGILFLSNWKKSTVLHEIAHLVTSSHYLGHGPEFINNFVFLIETFIDYDAATVFNQQLKLNLSKF